jgi:gamma-glutamyl hercynylcysteine S-oxide hydrolase
MCRHLAYLGPPVALDGFLVTTEHSLVEQARAPQHQSSGKDNPDGYGIGWFGADGTVHRYRSTVAMWEDTELHDRARSIITSGAIAAARLASPGSPVEETGNAPFTDGRWLFSLNGVVDGYNDGIGDELRGQMSIKRLAAIDGHADSEVVFALVLDQLEAGSTPGDALRSVVHGIESRTTGRLNLALTDGRALAATAVGNSLFIQSLSNGHDNEGVLVASEPLDTGPGWSRVPDRTLVEGNTRELVRSSL